MVHTGLKQAGVRLVHTGLRAVAVRQVQTWLRTAAVRQVPTGLTAAAVGLDQSGLREAADGLDLSPQGDEGMLQQCAWCDALVTIQVEHPLQQVREAVLALLAKVSLQVKI